METFGKIMSIAMPIFLTLFLIERFFEVRLGRKIGRGFDSISSFSSGITNVTKDVLGLSFTIVSYQQLYNHLALIHIQTTWLVYVLAFLAWDFRGYWGHRINHTVNFFWNQHVIHHSSEEFNLACALRQSIAGFANFFFFLLIPAALLGIPPKIVSVVAPLHLFLQFWYHTRLIGKMGWLEYVIVTPSHHRVHHAVNKIYQDKNLGEVFIFWDKLFGTFQAELPEEPCVYGISRPARTWNPIKINFQHLFLLFQDAWRAQNWWDKIRIWAMPTGWRPADVEEKYPVNSIKDPYTYQKYDTHPSQPFVWWAWAEMLFTYAIVTYLFAFIGKIGITNVFMYGGFIFLSVYAYTELMDRNRWAVLFSTIRAIVGLGLIYTLGDWFRANEFIGVGATFGVAAFLVLSVVMAVYFTFYESDKAEIPPSVFRA
jgi:alkylglycerol monooxygenase